LRKIYLLILLALIGFGCNNKSDSKTDLKPIYTNFENAWQERNLYGKVKSLKQYKTNFQSNGKLENPILNLSEKYTDFGELKEIENFGNFGEPIQKDTYEYDNEKFLIRTTSVNKLADINYIMNVENDTINNKSIRTVKLNDSLEQKIIVYFDDKDFITKQIAIEKNDTTIVNYKYIFNQTDNLITEIQFEIDENNPIQSLHYKYNETGNLIESSNKTEWMEFLIETEWKDERIFKQTEYIIPADLKKNLEMITEYDRKFNPVNLKVYENSELNRELKYEYEFDKYGNWTKRTISIKEHFINSNQFVPIYIETREIKYWN
jgi:hypothetical protein